ncbi:hypothetical protein N657DRAFT_220023 [Parathielavia appendiculata]|uniref:Urease accessory protein UreF n=1 Tax=Parathielavia appendiculata TaxID=2587402 RepID=A0AAN6U9T5_9PEZI|nr:hypothetical protein N657DRAFT_220023 [Parathielavia appendiculata]
MSANPPGRAHLGEIELDIEIAGLEHQLAQAKAKRQQLTSHSHPPLLKPFSSTLTSPNHFLLLLSDSALPLGSFAFSSGLESYLAHQKSVFYQPASFAAFLPLSISSYASTTLPFVLAAHRDPSLPNLAALDDVLDASIVCTVGRRASVAQGRALLSIWERSFAECVAAGGGGGGGGDEDDRGGAEALRGFSVLLRKSTATTAGSSSSAQREPVVVYGRGKAAGGCGDDPPAVAAHLAPLFGVICALVGLGLEQAAYVFMLGHVKALVSAAVRAGMFGPYQAQKTLASETVQGLITAMIEREWHTRVEEAGQNLPVMDLWVGRHEALYSRIFNS